MPDRRAPKGGYIGGTKAHYRRIVWNTLAETCPVPRAEAKAILMPSLEGDEIDVALSKGFRQENLHIVDDNPAIVATLKRRYPKIQTFGIGVVRLEERIPKLSIHVANFDFCSHASGVSDALTRAAGVMASDSIVAVTVQRGREPDLQLRLAEFEDYKDSHWQARNAQDKARLLSVTAALVYSDGRYAPRRHYPLRHHTYKSSSGKTTMLVGILWLDDHFGDQPKPVTGDKKRIHRLEQMIRFMKSYALPDTH